MVLQHYVRLLTLAITSILLLAACASSGPPPKVAHASALESNLALYVEPTPSRAGETLGSAVEARLFRAGFKVVSSKDAADVVLDLEVDVREQSGFIKVYSQGKLETSKHATAQLRLVGNGTTLETATAEYDADDGIPADKLDRLVAAVANSSSLAEYARNLKVRRARAAEATRQKADEAKAAKRKAQDAKRKAENEREDAAWNQIVLSDCREPTDVGGCLALQEFLAEFPTGRHAKQAKLVLEAGRPRIRALEDTRDWNNADVDVCRKPKQSTDCQKLHAYLQAHPTGAHADEAKAVIDKSRDTIEKLKKKEERAAAAAEKAEKRKEQHDQCKNECGNACIDFRHPGGVRVPCFNRCMPRCMKGIF